MSAIAVARAAVLAVAVLVAGCAAASTSASGPPPGTASAQPQAMAAMGGMCPMQVPGTTVTSTDVEGGVAISFVTGPGAIPEVRQRVRHMAEMHNHHAAGGMTMGGHASGPPGNEHEHAASGSPAPGGEHAGMMMMPTATATAEDVETGARIVLRPSDPTQLAALRQHAQLHVARMARGECPMMGSMR